jgi:hypothetical protein
MRRRRERCVDAAPRGIDTSTPAAILLAKARAAPGLRAITEHRSTGPVTGQAQ